jgi:hypothetical protein
VQSEGAVAYAERLKEEAKVLYGQKDFAAASQWYRTALRALEAHVSWRSPGSGSETAGPRLVLVKAAGALRVAEVVAMRSEGRVLVSFLDAPLASGAAGGKGGGAAAETCAHANSDDGSGGELVVVPGSDVVATVCPGNDLRALTCALRLNAARCEIGLGRAVAKAIWDCAVALRVAALPLPAADQEEAGPASGGWDRAATQATAHVLRAKAHLALVDDAKVQRREELAAWSFRTQGKLTAQSFFSIGRWAAGFQTRRRPGGRAGAG